MVAKHLILLLLLSLLLLLFLSLLLLLLLSVEEEERLKLEEEEKIQALLDISEDDYEALNPNRQREIDNIRQKRYLEKKRKYVTLYIYVHVVTM